MPASADCIACSVCRVRVESLHMTRPGTQPKSASCAATCRGKESSLQLGHSRRCNAACVLLKLLGAQATLPGRNEPYAAAHSCTAARRTCRPTVALSADCIWAKTPHLLRGCSPGGRDLSVVIARAVCRVFTLGVAHQHQTQPAAAEQPL